jgi:hypothetical protein
MTPKVKEVKVNNDVELKKTVDEKGNVVKVEVLHKGDVEKEQEAN